MRNLLKSKKLRVTDFRLGVLAVFEKYQNAVSLEQIEEDLGKHDRITLYRTIKLFISKGLIHEIIMPGNIKKLALCESGCDEANHDHHHIHFRCSNCAEIYCIDLDNFPSVQLAGFKIESIEIQANGICKNCA